jgi:hypothetical protein
MKSSSILCAAVFLVACGSRHGDDFNTDAGDNPDGDLVEDTGDLFGGDTATEAAPPCVNLQCQQVTCGGGGSTTVSGTVYDPAGNNGIYNVIVYVPNATVDPIMHGPVCEKCDTVSGKPVVTALTDVKGNFVLKDVPVGSNIPLVIQIGKFRRQFKLPNVVGCQDTKVPTKMLTLPKNKMEGDMPKMAMSTGCDPIDSLMKKIGIDAAEFTNENQNGMVHVFTGTNGAMVTTGQTDAYAFWGDYMRMQKYDILLNNCECSPYPRATKGPAYDNLKKFLDSGGRFFGSHYHVNWFADSSAPMEFQQAAQWKEWGSCGSPPWVIDTSFPKGKAMSDWMHVIFPNSPVGQVAVTSGCMVADILGTYSMKSQRWIYAQNMSSVGYVSINTPLAKMPDDRCGRAVLSDLHVGVQGGGMLVEQEAALEFMFFDLSSCVQNDMNTPQPPPPDPK